MTTKKNAIVVSSDTGDVNGLIAQAVEKGLSVETMERLFALRKEVKAETAKEEFVKALATFQESVPTIIKDKKVMNKGGTSVRYLYAPLESIVKQIKKPLKEAQLSYRWDTRTEDGQVTAICYVTHSLGHTESSSFSAPGDTNEYMTSPQRIASSITFSKRQSLLNALGIATADEDDDATTANKEKDAKSPKARIINRLKALGEKVGTKEDIEQAVMRLTNLALEEGNFDEIITRLEVVIAERHENH